MKLNATKMATVMVLLFSGGYAYAQNNPQASADSDASASAGAQAGAGASAGSSSGGNSMSTNLEFQASQIPRHVSETVRNTPDITVVNAQATSACRLPSSFGASGPGISIGGGTTDKDVVCLLNEHFRIGSEELGHFSPQNRAVMEAQLVDEFTLGHRVVMAEAVRYEERQHLASVDTGRATQVATAEPTGQAEAAQEPTQAPAQQPAVPIGPVNLAARAP